MSARLPDPPGPIVQRPPAGHSAAPRPQRAPAIPAAAIAVLPDLFFNGAREDAAAVVRAAFRTDAP